MSFNVPVHFTYQGGFRSGVQGHKTIRIKVHPHFITPEQLNRKSLNDLVLTPGGSAMVLNYEYKGTVNIAMANRKVYYIVSDISPLYGFY